MPSPNPVWGVHVVPGGIAWAKVRREDDGSFRVLEWRTESAPGDAAGASRAAAEGLSRRGVRGWPAFVAVPDASGSFVTARLLAEETDLEGDDLVRELHEHTTFEPEAATLRAKHLRNDGRRRVFLVAAIPSAQERQAADPVHAVDSGNLGTGFASASTYLGALALGLLPPGTFGLEVMARTTAVYAADPGLVRRYLIAAGAEDFARDPAFAEAIAHDAKNAAEYHREQRSAMRRDAAPLPDPQFVPLGPLLGAGALRSAIAPHLPGFSGAAPAGEPAARIVFDRPPEGDAGAVAGAVGAALEAFEPEERRLALRQLPSDVPTPEQSGGAARLAMAASVVAALGVGVWWFGFRNTTDDGTALRAGTNAPGARATPDVVSQDVVVHGPFATLARRAAFAAALRDVDAATRENGGKWARSMRIECDAQSVSVTIAPAPRVPQELLSRLIASGNRSVDVDSAALRWKRPVAVVPLPETIPDTAIRDVRRALDSAHGTWTGRPASSGPRLGMPVSWDVSAQHALVAAFERTPPHAPARLSWADGVLAIDDGQDPGGLASADAAPESLDALLAGAAARPGPGSFVAPAVAAATPLGVVVNTDQTRVRISVPAGAEGRRLECRAPGADSWGTLGPRGGLGEAAVEVPHVVLGPPGVWTYRVSPGGPEATVELRPDIRVDVLGAVDDRTVRLRFSLASEGTVHETAGAFAIGARLTGVSTGDPSGARLQIDAGLRVAAVRVSSGASSTIEQVPEFLPDGRVRRDAAGRPVLRETVVERPVRVVEVDLGSASGDVRTVSGKMTDG